MNNGMKHPVFSVEERVEMIQRMVDFEGIQRVVVGRFDGLLVEYARSVGAEYIIRGLRATMDFEYEFQINALNRHLAPDVDTVYFMASPEHSFLSSSAIREIGVLGGSMVGLLVGAGLSDDLAARWVEKAHEGFTVLGVRGVEDAAERERIAALLVASGGTASFDLSS